MVRFTNQPMVYGGIQILKRISLMVLSSLCFITVYFIFSLWLSAKQSMVVSLVIALFMFGIIICGIICLFKPIKYLPKKRSTNLTLIILSGVVSIATIFITLFNYGFEKSAYDHESIDSFTASDKISFYHKMVLDTSSAKQDTEDFSSEQVGAFTFYYDGQDNKKWINSSVKAVEAKKNQFSSIFNLKEKPPVKIILYNNIPTPENAPKPVEGSIGGYYVASEETIYLQVPSGNKREREFQRKVVHEYTHHLFNTLIKKYDLSFADFPMWFHEGLATYVGSINVGVGDNYIRELEYLNFNQMKTPAQINDHLRSPYNPYFQSMWFINHLLNDVGNDFIPKIIKERKNHQFDQSFKNVMGIGFETYSNDFLQQLKNVPSDLITARKEVNPKMALEKALEVNTIVPNLYQSNIQLGKIYMELGNFKKSKEYAQRLVEQNPGEPSPYQGLATKIVVADLERAIKLSKISVKHANEDEFSFYQEKLETLISVKRKVEEGEPLSGYLEIFRNDYVQSDILREQLIKDLLNKYPNVESGRKEMVSLLES
ncbi:MULTISPECIES: hypothetical protein [Halobacillus]|uniref:hypothetical protein n=1 Tax=Halobacillus TaxID=45667 RepID=UPI001371E1DE|nr:MULTISPECIES: hypothetical protein [Halobacillus]MYL31638.1 hypothetical protein [Halobacillus halophilus]MYL39983.1 hypothetical protein [Halobacillus litoralis]